MSAIVKINNFIAALIDGIKSFFYIRLWSPFFIYAIVSAIVAFMVFNPFSSIWSGLIIPIGKSSLFGGGSAFVHYPQHLLMSPVVYSRIGVILAVLIESVLVGAAILMFADFFSGQKLKFSDAIRQAFSKYPFLILTNILIYAVIFAMSYLLQDVLSNFLEGSPRRQLAFSVGINFLLFLFIAPFIYIIPYLVLHDENWFVAIGKSIKTFFKNFFTTYFLIAVTQLLVLPFSIMLNNSRWLMQKFSPGIIEPLQYIQIGAYMIASFLFTAMLTRIFVEYHE